MLPFKVNYQGEPKYTLKLEDGKESFTITPKAFHDFLEHNDLETKISHVLGTIDPQNPQSLLIAAKFVKSLILKGEFPKTLLAEILAEYKKFGGILEGKEVHVSFLKDGESHKVRGDSSLVHKIKEKWSSLFLPHPTFDNPTIVVTIKPPIFKELQKEVKYIEKRVEKEFANIIHNSSYSP